MCNLYFINYYLKESSEIFLEILKMYKNYYFYCYFPKIRRKKELQGQKKHKKAHKKAAGQKKTQKSTCAF